MFWETLWALVLGFALSGAVQAFVVPGRRCGGSLGRPPARDAGEGSLLGMAQLVVLVRGQRAGQVAVRPRRRLHRVDGLHVRLHQPGGRARHRAVAADRLAVRARRIRRRRHHDRDARRLLLPRLVPRRDWPRPADRLTGEAATAPTTATAATTGHAAGRARWPAAAQPGRLGRRRRLHDLRPDHAATRTRHRLRHRRVPAAAGAGQRSGAPLFLTGHGFWSSIENAVVGPFIAIISFVCSVGNVPLAAALWHGGISFGGVIAFVFADLITLPLLLDLPQVSTAAG